MTEPETPPGFLDSIRGLFAEPRPTTTPRPCDPFRDDPLAAPSGGWAATALARELDTLRDTTEGGRNAALNVAAFNLGQIVGGGGLDYIEVAEALTVVARDIGLDGHEIAPTIRSGLKSGEQHPRTAPERQEATSWSSTSSNGQSRDSSAAPWDIAPASPTAAPGLTSSPAGTDATGATSGSTPQDAPSERSSWYFRSLDAAIAGETTEEPPGTLQRLDGAHMFYAGKVNGLIGESESGKTWVALLAVTQTLAAGQRVLYFDFEDSASGIIGRLRSMGATDEHLTRFAYIDPDEGLGPAQRVDLGDAVAAWTPQLVIIDGFNAAMTLLGLDINDNGDATVFSQKLLKPLARTGATVVYVDHLPKSRDARGKGGIGAQAKRAMTTGCTLTVDVMAEFGRGMTGKLRLTVDKDRAGHVRAVSENAKGAGFAVLVSNADTGAIEVTISAPNLIPAGEQGGWRPTHLMEAVSRYLEGQTSGVSKTSVVEHVAGKTDRVRDALGFLITDGYVAATTGPRNVILNASLKPYREDPLT